MPWKLTIFCRKIIQLFASQHTTRKRHKCDMFYSNTITYTPQFRARWSACAARTATETAGRATQIARGSSTACAHSDITKLSSFANIDIATTCFGSICHCADFRYVGPLILKYNVIKDECIENSIWYSSKLI